MQQHEKQQAHEHHQQTTEPEQHVHTHCKCTLRLTTKLLTLEAFVVALTLIAFILTVVTYLHDARWDYTERAIFQDKYEFFLKRHERKDSFANRAHVHMEDEVLMDRSGHATVVEHHPNHTDPRAHHEHMAYDHQFSPRYEGTAITSIVLTCIACLAAAVELGLSFCFRNPQIRRISNGTIHLCICYALLTSLNIDTGQMIKTDLGYHSDPNHTNEWITLYFQGCRIGHPTAWANATAVQDKVFEACIKAGGIIENIPYDKDPTLIFEECHTQGSVTRTASRNNLGGNLLMEEYGYKIAVCQLWLHKLILVVIEFIALCCSISIVRSAFRVYLPGSIAPEEVVPEEEKAFVEVWVDNSIDDSEVLEFADLIAEQEQLDEIEAAAAAIKFASGTMFVEPGSSDLQAQFHPHPQSQPQYQPQPQQPQRTSHHRYYIHAEDEPEPATTPGAPPTSGSHSHPSYGDISRLSQRRHSAAVEQLRERGTFLGRPARLDSTRSSVQSTRSGSGSGVGIPGLGPGGSFMHPHNHHNVVPRVIRKSAGPTGRGNTRRRHSIISVTPSVAGLPVAAALTRMGLTPAATAQAKHEEF